MRIQDRGATRLQFRAQNIDGVVDLAKRAGLKIATVGGAATPIPPNFKGALIVDPSNFFVSLFEPCDGCAPREAPPALPRSSAASAAPAASTPPPVTRPALLFKEEWREPPSTPASAPTRTSASRPERRDQPESRGQALRRRREGDPRRAARRPHRPVDRA